MESADFLEAEWIVVSHTQICSFFKLLQHLVLQFVMD